jgi:hypothetical protein
MRIVLTANCFEACSLDFVCKDAKQIAAFKNNEKARTGSTLDRTEVRQTVASRLVVGFPGCVANDNDSEPRALYTAQPHHRLQMQGNS